MSSGHLCPCPACNRHVMTDAGVCPFCQTALPASFCAAAAPPAARGRMSRAARLLAGATLVGASACSSTQSNIAPPYGIPPRFDAGTADRDVDSGAGGAAGSDGATGADGAPSDDAADGGPPPTDGSASG